MGMGTRVLTKKGREALGAGRVRWWAGVRGRAGCGGTKMGGGQGRPKVEGFDSGSMHSQTFPPGHEADPGPLTLYQVGSLLCTM